MLVSVPPTFPGLIESIRAKGRIQLGFGSHLFDIAFLLGFSLASTVYFALSKLFPARETVHDRAIIELETPPGDGGASYVLDKVGVQVDVAKIA